MKHIQKTLEILMLLIILFAILLTSAFAEQETAATPTDLDSDIVEEKPEEQGNSLEIIITKSLQSGQSWDGKIKRKTPSILKLDFDYAQTVHILIEGHDVLAAVQKADQYTEDAPEQLTDPETDKLIIDLNAEAGSYLLTLRAGENSLLAMVSVSIMTQNEYETWIAENQKEDTEETAEEIEEKSEEETEGTESKEIAEKEMEQSEEAEGEPGEVQETIETAEESEAKEGEEPEQIPVAERSINVDLSWDVPDPMIGDTAHFKAILNGYEGLEYSMQWQYSLNRNDWIDLTGETTDTLNVVVTEENNFFYWRIIVYLEQDEEI